MVLEGANDYAYCRVYNNGINDVVHLVSYLTIIELTSRVCDRLLERLMSPSPKSQVMFASAFSWSCDFVIELLAFILIVLRYGHFVEYNINMHAMNWCSGRWLWGRIWLCIPGVTTQVMLGVSLRARRDTTQVMLGVSLRARRDTTLVQLMEL